jgi:hypothetical protein
LVWFVLMKDTMSAAVLFADILAVKPVDLRTDGRSVGQRETASEQVRGKHCDSTASAIRN